MANIKDQKVYIYLIDDDELHLKILQGKFESSTTYELKAFQSGETFLDFILKNPIPKNVIPIVILDYFLRSKENEEAKNGVEILKLLKNINPNIEVIMLSAMDDVDIATAAMHYGAVTFVKKNENSFTRLNSNIQWIISQKDFESKKKRHKRSRIYFVIVLSILLLLTVLFFLPDLLKK
ncbi:MAG: response regulator [Bacteroidota bacterium]